jgi:hypothetical protein
MAKLTVHEIQEAARALVLASPGGVRYSDFHRGIATANPETPPNTIHGAIQRLEVRFADQIEKPTRGVYRSAEGTKATTSKKPSSGASAPPSVSSPAEADYYQPFADWLVREHQEATVARALGGAGLSGKWGTPDVLGVYKPLPSDFVQFPKEIIAAEIKVDAKSPVVAFGQATAYRLFSTKSYIVLPKRGQEADLDRVEALAVLFGIGLVVFDGPPSAPNFEVEVRAQRLLPDMFYVNEFAHRLSKHNREMFNELFA